MKKLQGLAMLSMTLLMACNKPNMPETSSAQDVPTTKSMLSTSSFSTTDGTRYGLSIRNGMLRFANAERYADFVSLDEAEILKVLKPYEQTADFTSLAEQYPVTNDVGKEGLYGAVISSLLNADQLVEIESKVFRINASAGKVYAISSQGITEQALSALVREYTQDNTVEERSVDEDLFELLGHLRVISGPGNGCPQTGQNITDHRSTVSSFCPQAGGSGTPFFDVEAKYRRYGVYFELFAISRGVAFNANSPYAGCYANYLQCAPATYRRNNSATQFVENATYIYPGYGKKNWYNGAYRLCNFYVMAKTIYNNKSTPWTIDCRFNYTP